MILPYKNNEYYDDWTAFLAIQNIMRKETSKMNDFSPRKTPHLASGQVYELLTRDGSTFPVLIISAAIDDSAATLRLFDTPRHANSASVSINAKTMYVDLGKPGYVFATDLGGKIADLSNDDLLKIRRSMVLALNLNATTDYKAECERLNAELAKVKKELDELKSRDGADMDLDLVDFDTFYDTQRENDRLAAMLDVYKALYGDLLSKITTR